MDLHGARQLERRFERQDKALKEAWALLDLARKTRGLQVGGRGRLHRPEERLRVRTLVQEALLAGARASAACQVLGISTRTFQRWSKPDASEDLRPQARRPPPNQLSEDERRQVLRILRSSEFRGLSPWQIVPRLADQGIYLASESTFYRLLRGTRPPRRVRARVLAHSPDEQSITRPNQLWSWDISYLKGPRPGNFLYLYLVMDVFSRRIMGWQIHLEEAAEHASQLICRCCDENHVDPVGLILHSDNGSPMKGAPLVNLLQRLGVRSSFSRPRTSNDNAFVEALFHTLKGRPTYPLGGFSSLRMARQWVSRFVRWYNRWHLHSGLGYTTPDARYSGASRGLWEQRTRLYQQARAHRPARWPGPVRQWAPPLPPRVRVRLRQPVLPSLTAPLPESPSCDNRVDIHRAGSGTEAGLGGLSPGGAVRGRPREPVLAPSSSGGSVLVAFTAPSQDSPGWAWRPQNGSGLPCIKERTMASTTSSTPLPPQTGNVNQDQLSTLVWLYRGQLDALKQHADANLKPLLDKVWENVRTLETMCGQAITSQAKDPSFRLFAFDPVPKTFTWSPNQTPEMTSAVANTVAVQNETGAALDTSAQIEYELEQSFTTTFTAGLAVGIQQKVSASLSILLATVKSEVTVHLDLNFEYSSSNTVSRRNLIRVQQPLHLPGGKRYYACVWISPLVATGDYSCRFMPAFSAAARKTPLSNKSIPEIMFYRLSADECDTLNGVFSLEVEQKGTLSVQGGFAAEVAVSESNPLQTRPNAVRAFAPSNA